MLFDGLVNVVWGSAGRAAQAYLGLSPAWQLAPLVFVLLVCSTKGAMKAIMKGFRRAGVALVVGACRAGVVFVLGRAAYGAAQPYVGSLSGRALELAGSLPSFSTLGQSHLGVALAAALISAYASHRLSTSACHQDNGGCRGRLQVRPNRARCLANPQRYAAPRAWKHPLPRCLRP